MSVAPSMESYELVKQFSSSKKDQVDSLDLEPDRSKLSGNLPNNINQMEQVKLVSGLLKKTSMGGETNANSSGGREAE